MKLNTQQIDKTLDKINELKELQKEANIAGKLNKWINDYMDEQYKALYNDMKTESYDILKRTIYDLWQILWM